VIFVTVGAQMPFDRLVRSVDEWAGSRGRRDVFAQIGPSSYEPRHIRHSRFIAPLEFRRHVEHADVIVAHAGMGSIISAVELGKPILVMPRRGDLGETRNDHQIATAERFGAMQLVQVATDEQDLLRKLDAFDRSWSHDHSPRLAPRQWVACPFSHEQTDVEGIGAAMDSACSHLLMALDAFLAGRSPLEVQLPTKAPAKEHTLQPSYIGVRG
jgi:UDP-N-acetylglucosamine transferase subunit ALG13